MQALSESVKPGRPRRPLKIRQAQPTDITGHCLPELGTIRDERQQPGDDHDRQTDQQDGTEYRGQPRTSDGTPRPQPQRREGIEESLDLRSYETHRITSLRS